MNPVYYGILFAGGLFVGMLVLLEVGRRIGIRRLKLDPQGAKQGVGAVDGAVFALLGLLVAFTFSAAAARFDARRQLVAEEANDIGTAWLRLDLLSSESASSLRPLFRQYLDSRLATYQNVADAEATQAELTRTAKLQEEIWKQAVAGCTEPGRQHTAVVVLPALNQMIDITTTRTHAARTHSPLIIFAMLGGLALAASLLAGYGMAGSKSRSWIHTVGFAAVMAATVYVIVDLEYPRFGLIHLKAADQVLIDLRQTMN